MRTLTYRQNSATWQNVDLWLVLKMIFRSIDSAEIPASQKRKSHVKRQFLGLLIKLILISGFRISDFRRIH